MHRMQDIHLSYNYDLATFKDYWRDFLHKNSLEIAHS